MPDEISELETRLVWTPSFYKLRPGTWGLRYIEFSACEVFSFCRDFRSDISLERSSWIRLLFTVWDRDFNEIFRSFLSSDFFV